MRALKLTLLTGLVGALGQDEEVSGGGISVQILGQSGKFTLYKTSLGKGQDPDAVTMELDSIREVLDNGETACGTGNGKHLFNQFASQAFTFETGENKAVGNDGAQATTVRFHSALESGGSTIGTIGFEVAAFSAGGAVGPAGAGWMAREGDMKWNIDVEGWKFCETVDPGSALEVVVKVKGKNAGSEAGADKESVDLGGGVSIGLTNKYSHYTAGAWTAMEMPSGYPQVDAQNKFIFRFPVFAADEKIAYDPFMSTGVNSGALGHSLSLLIAGLSVLRIFRD